MKPIAADVVRPVTSTGKLRPEHEKMLEEMVRDTKDSEVAEKSDLLSRLGELQAGLYRQAAEPAKAKLLAKLIRTYDALLDTRAFRDYARRDHAIHTYAHVLATAGMAKEARAAFERLTRDHPNSALVVDAYVALGDDAYARGDHAQAHSYFERLAIFPKSPLRTFGLYKLGWTRLAQGKPARALEAFGRALEAAAADPGATILERAARDGQVAAASELGAPAQAIAALRDVAQIARLAELYVETGRHDRAAIVYRALIAKEPAHARVCEWRTAAGIAAFHANRKPTTIELCATEVESAKRWAAEHGVLAK